MDYEKIEKDFKNWLYHTARWKILDFLKKPQRNILSPNNDRELNSLETIIGNEKNNDIEKEIEGQKKILRLLDSLCEEEKEIIFHRYIEELKYSEIVILLNEKITDKEEIKKEAARLRKICERALKKLEKLVRDDPRYREVIL